MRSEGTNCLSGPVRLSVLVNMPPWPRGSTLLLSLTSEFPHELTGHPLVSTRPPPPALLHCYFSPSIFTSHYKSPPFSFAPPFPLVLSRLICYYPVIKYPLSFSTYMSSSNFRFSLPSLPSSVPQRTHRKGCNENIRTCSLNISLAKQNMETLMKRRRFTHINRTFPSLDHVSLWEYHFGGSSALVNDHDLRKWEFFLPIKHQFTV